MRIPAECWNLDAQEGGLAARLGGNIPENIPICARVLSIWPVWKRNSFKKTKLTASKMQPSEVNLYFVSLLLVALI